MVNKSGEVFSSVTESNGVYQPIYEIKDLEGAVYEISASEDIYTTDGTLRAKKGQVVDTITTKSNESVESKALYLGKYSVKEIKAPEGMVLNDKIHNIELTYEGQNIEITETSTSFYNERQKAEIELKKVLEKDNEYGIGGNGEIKNVVFGLFADEDVVAEDKTIIPKDGLIEIVSVSDKGIATCKTDIPFRKVLF